jgi:tryptophan synthase
MEQIKATFAQCKQERRTALVPYVTAGYPTPEETPGIMLAMQTGGAGMLRVVCPLLHPHI